MTSRRSFLGLLAAAPFAAPVMAKATVGSPFALVQGETIQGMVLGTHVSTSVEGEMMTHFNLSDAQFTAFKQALDAPLDLNEALAALMQGQSPWDAPNRLHGARINSDGEAV